MRLCYCLGIILINFGYLLGLEVRLWPVNARGNEGFVEVYHDNTWGLIGSPDYRFSDETSALLCKTLGISDFGYSSGWTSIDNYGGVAWTYGLECYGNETVLDQCHFPNKFKLDSYTNKTEWGYRHGTRLFCVDAQITGGPTQNSGLIEASIDGNTYSLCYDGVDMNAANVVCNHLGYNGAISIKRKEPGVFPLYRKKLSCTGCEYSLSECDRSQSLTSKCIFAATVTCKAVRLARMNRYTDEGPVEVFHNGSWGMIGDPGFRFNDETASYLCNRFNLGNVGFSTTGNLLQTYGRKAWLSSLSCLGNEKEVMECSHSRFSTVPSLQHTYKRGTWLYCFGFDVTQMRLTGGVNQNEGRVELLINGRWGYIATHGIANMETDNAAKVICREMGYSGQGSVLSDGNHGRKHDHFWMSLLKCTGNERSLQQCWFYKGSLHMTYEHPYHLRVRCSGLEVRLWPVNARGNEGFVEVYHENTWGLIGSPAYRFTDETAALLCKTLGLSDFGYSSGWTSIDNYGGVGWTYGLECYGNETVLDQCHFPNKWNIDSYTNNTDWGYRHGTRLFCVDARITGGPTPNSGLIEASLDGNKYSLCYDGVDMNAANVVCNHLGYDGAISINRKEPGAYPLYRKKLSCTGCEYSLSECDRSQSLFSQCIFAATVTCKAVRLARMNQYTDEGPVEVFHNGSWGMVGNPGFRFNDKTASYLCNRFNLGNAGFSSTGNSLQTFGRKAWLSYLHCLGNETNVMECKHSRFSTVPSLQHTHKRGTWLYCFGFDVTQMRLTGGVYQNEGRVELLINGRWGYIATQGMTHNDTDNAAKVVCREMGYSGQGSVLSDENHGRKHDLFWMSFLKCTGNESSLQQCKFNKGSSPMAYEHPFHLRVRCSGRRVSGYEPHIAG